MCLSILTMPWGTVGTVETYVKAGVSRSRAGHVISGNGQLVTQDPRLPSDTIVLNLCNVSSAEIAEPVVPFAQSSHDHLFEQVN